MRFTANQGLDGMTFRYRRNSAGLHVETYFVPMNTPTSPAFRVAAMLSLLALFSGGCDRPADEHRAEQPSLLEEISGHSLVRRASSLFMIPIPANMDIRSEDDRMRLQRDVLDFGAGGIVLFQGDPLKQAAIVAWLQAKSTEPLLVAVDAEWGAGMRMDGMPVFPRAMGISATWDHDLAYALGRRTGLDARAAGVNMVFAPVADVNSESRNPVIGTRAWSDDPDTTGHYATAFMRGLTDAGVLAVPKHFPGHGSTTTDSHSGITRAEIGLRDLLPFRRLAEAGAPAMMSGHIVWSDSLPASLSHRVSTAVLRDSLHFQGLLVTDALNMVGATAFGSPPDVALAAVRAGADLLLMSPRPEAARARLVQAVRDSTLRPERLNEGAARVLKARRAAGRVMPEMGLLARRMTETDLEAADAARRAVTLVTAPAPPPHALPIRLEGRPVVLVQTDFRLQPVAPSSVADPATVLQRELQRETKRDVRIVRVSARDWARGLANARGDIERAGTVIWIDAVGTVPVAGWDGEVFSRRLADLVRSADSIPPQRSLTGIALENPWLSASMAAHLPTVLVAYDRHEPTLVALAEVLTGRSGTTGRLPVHVSTTLPRGTGHVLKASRPHVGPAESVGMDAAALDNVLNILREARADSAFPAATVAIGRHGTVVLSEAVGTPSWVTDRRVTTRDIFDLASMTKVVATTTLAMLLVEEGRLELDRPVAEYLPAFGAAGKGLVTVRDLLAHHSGLVPFIPFHAQGVRTAAGVRARILADSLVYAPGDDVRYSDFGPITLAWVMEEITGKPFDVLARERVFEPLGMLHTGFRPNRPSNRPDIVPTELDDYFRRRLLRGEVHDENAWILGGTAGHAGLFSTVEDLAIFASMMVNEGRTGAHQFLKPETIRSFTTRINPSGPGTRALGWDTRSLSGYSSAGAHFGPRAYGHTGYTGTSMWIDPDQGLYVILLTNRVHPTRNNSRLVPVRPAVADAAFLGLVDRDHRGNEQRQSECSEETGTGTC